MSANLETLIDTDLTYDDEAAGELGTPVPERIADEVVRSCRFTLSQLPIVPVQLEDVQARSGGLIHFVCTLAPGANSRVAKATIAFSFASSDVIIVDLLPEEVKADQAIKVTNKVGGKLSFNVLPGVTPQASGETAAEYLYYPVTIRGFGVGSPRAQWNFDENPVLASGAPLRTDLLLTLAAPAGVPISVSVSTQVSTRPISGIGGWLDEILPFVLRRENEFSYPLILPALLGV